MDTATFRFYAELNDFLPTAKRQRALCYRFRGTPAIKDAMEALGVPHPEVDLVLVNGCSVDFAYHLRPGDYVSAYPALASLDISSLARLKARPLRHTAFIADVHLRKLARLLRLLGFDTVYSNDYTDAEIVAIARGEERILLTRDRQLLKHSAVVHGYWIRSERPLEQAREVVRRFALALQVQPFRRCLSCNGLLVPVDKETVLSRIPPKTARWQDEYLICQRCEKLYWRGTHFPKLQAAIERILAPTALC